MPNRTKSRQPVARKKGSPSKTKGAGSPATQGKTPALVDEQVIFPAKRRCAGATRYGDPCRFWATAGSDFCYWCQQASSPRYPLPAPPPEVVEQAARKEPRKRRCIGVTVFGDQCRYWASGSSDYCLWCLNSGQGPGPGSSGSDGQT